MQSQLLAKSSARPSTSSSGRRYNRVQNVARPVAVRSTTVKDVAVSTNGATAEGTPINMMDLTELSGIIKMVHETDIVEFELKSKRFNLSVKKKEALKAQEVQVIHAAAPQMAAPVMAAPMPMAAPAAAPAPAPAPAAAPVAAAPKPVAQPTKVEGVEVCSPMSGTLYRAPAPGEPFFVKEGDRVTKGQTVCIIEAMKLMNEIEAEVSGTIVKFVAENGKPLSPGQPIVIIKP